jgi:homeobox protein ESX1
MTDKPAPAVTQPPQPADGAAPPVARPASTQATPAQPTPAQPAPAQPGTAQTAPIITDKSQLPKVKEIGGPEGPEPTRYGDWEVKGRVSDF